MSRPINGDDAFRGISHPTRRRILELLKKGDRTVAEIVTEFQLSQPTVSEHLQVLLRSRLVSQRRRRNNRVYRLNGTRIRTVQSWVARLS